MSLLVLDTSDGVTVNEIWGQIDATLCIPLTASPVGVQAANRPGVWAYDSVHNTLWLATAGDGTTGGTAWVQIFFPIAATTSDPGVVALATEAMAIAGTDNTTAITPLIAAEVYAAQGSLTAAINNVQDQINMNDTDISDLNTEVAALIAAGSSSASVIATPNDLALRDSSGRSQFVDGASGEDAVNYNQLSTTNTNVSSLSTSLSTLSGALGSPTSSDTVGEICKRDGSGCIEITAYSSSSTSDTHAATLGQVNVVANAVAAVKMANGGATKVAGFSAAASTFYLVDISAGSFAAALPDATACDGQEIEFAIIATAGAHLLTFTFFSIGQVALNFPNGFGALDCISLRAANGSWYRR